MTDTDPAAVVASWSPCCRVLREGDLPEAVMHNGSCRERHGGVLGPTVRLVATEALAAHQAVLDRYRALLIVEETKTERVAELAEQMESVPRARLVAALTVRHKP